MRLRQLEELVPVYWLLDGSMSGLEERDRAEWRLKASSSLNVREPALDESLRKPPFGVVGGRGIAVEERTGRIERDRAILWGTPIRHVQLTARPSPPAAMALSTALGAR